MKEFFKKNLIPFSVFITGACVLVVEVVAVRVLSPYFGGAIFTVSSVITVVLLALSVGYYVGGKFADKYPDMRAFFGIIATSGVLLLLFYLFSKVMLPSLSESLPITYGPLVSAILIFLVPALLLGTLSPYAVKLQSMISDEGIGAVAGRMFFWSTLGSIVGSLSAGFVLIPNFGINAIFITSSIVLFALGIVPLFVMGVSKKIITNLSVFFLVLTFGVVFFSLKTEKGVVYSKDGIYEKIVVYDDILDGRPVRYFKQDKSSSGAMYLDTDDPTDMVFGYAKFYKAYEVFKPEVKNSLILGGGAYSLTRAFLAEFPNASVDVSEIEPSLYDMAKKYFRLEEDPRLLVSSEDGRRFLNKSEKKYDLIFSDVYYSLYSIPAHFTTEEFLSLANSKLTDGGVFMANLIGDLSRQGDSFIFSEMKTFQKVFPNSYFFAVRNPGSFDTQSFIFVGHNSKERVDFSSKSISENKNEVVRNLGAHLIEPSRFALDKYLVFKDDYAPAEFMSASVYNRQQFRKRGIDGKEIIEVLKQQLSFGPRFMGSSGKDKTRDFISEEMQAMGMPVFVQDFEYKDTKGDTHTLSNIIARLNPEEERRVVLGAHYDSKMLADLDMENPTAPVPGANDSASGVAVLIETARYLSESQGLSGVGVDFVFFDGEEGDPYAVSNSGDFALLGSIHFVQNLRDFYPEKFPESAVVVDMVCDKDLNIYKENESVKNAPQIVSALWSIAEKLGIESFKQSGGYDYSIYDDHTPFNNAGIPSALIIDFDYPYWHTTEDTIDKCSAESLEDVGRVLVGYLKSL